MITTQIKDVTGTPTMAPRLQYPAQVANGPTRQGALDALPLNLVPQNLTEWVPAPVLAGLALEAARTLYWVSEPSADQGGMGQPDSIATTLALVTYCCAVGACSWEKAAECVTSDPDAWQAFGGEMVQPRQVRLICGQHSEVLKGSVARVFERVWLYRHGAMDLETAGKVAFMPAVFQAKFAASFRRSFREEAHQRVQRTLKRDPSPAAPEANCEAEPCCHL
jgi:hypothetical protein